MAERHSRHEHSINRSRGTRRKSQSAGKTTEEERRHAMSDRDRNHQRVIAIDGPAGAGKTTVAKDLAARLGAILFDTGALYRSVTLAALRSGIALDDAAALERLAVESQIDIRPGSVADGRLIDVLLDGEDVTWAIRTPEVDTAVSEVSAHQGVRTALLPVQRRIASGIAIVMVGRDIASVVVPDAGVKIYLDASVAERARRRAKDLRAQGVVVSDDEVEADLKARDAYDSSREHAPLTESHDAIHVDTDHLSIPAVVDRLESLVHERWRQFGIEQG